MTKWQVCPHGNYMSDDETPIQIIDGKGNTVACNTDFYPTAITADHADTIVSAVNGYAEMASLAATLREQLATARLDGEWLAKWVHVYANHIPKAADEQRISDIANRMSGQS